MRIRLGRDLVRFNDQDVVSVILGLFTRPAGFLWQNRGCWMQGVDGLAGVARAQTRERGERWAPEAPWRAGNAGEGLDVCGRG